MPEFGSPFSGLANDAYASVSEAKTGLARYLTQYNSARPHSRLADRTPDEAYFTPLPLRAAA